MTRSDYLLAFENGFDRTVDLLESKGKGREAATTLARQAWAEGWEDAAAAGAGFMVRSWVNRIALSLCGHPEPEWDWKAIEKSLEIETPSFELHEAPMRRDRHRQTVVVLSPVHQLRRAKRHQAIPVGRSHS